MISLFTRHSKEQHADSIADYCPNDDLWAAKKIDGKNLRQLLLGFAKSLQLAEDQLETVWEQIDPSTTTDYIDEWEKAVGIPDDCFFGSYTIEERRVHVVIKLSSSVQTEEDFEDLAALLDLEVDVYTEVVSNSLKFPLEFPFTFTSGEERFTIYVDVITPFPVGVPLLECLFNKLKPANTQVVFI